MDKYECTICGYIYDEAEGDADQRYRCWHEIC